MDHRAWAFAVVLLTGCSGRSIADAASSDLGSDDALVDVANPDATSADWFGLDATMDDALDVAGDGPASCAFADPATQFACILADAVFSPACEYIRRCCSASDRANPVLIDDDIEAYCEDPSTFRHVAAPPTIDPARTEWVRSAFAACATAIGAHTNATTECGRFMQVVQSLTATPWMQLPECVAAIHGLGSIGSPCAISWECQSHNCAMGACIASPMTGSDCHANLICQPGETCVDSVCTAFVHAGGACNDDRNCEPGLYCDGGTSATGHPTGVCASLLGDGAQSADGSRCASGLVAGGACVAACGGSADP